MNPWTCEAHQLTTVDDCPKCDDEMVALAESADSDSPESGCPWCPAYDDDAHTPPVKGEA